VLLPMALTMPIPTIATRRTVHLSEPQQRLVDQTHSAIVAQARS
jgi:hypothetical protein